MYELNSIQLWHMTYHYYNYHLMFSQRTLQTKCHHVKVVGRLNFVDMASSVNLCKWLANQHGTSFNVIILVEEKLQKIFLVDFSSPSLTLKQVKTRWGQICQKNSHRQQLRSLVDPWHKGPHVKKWTSACLSSLSLKTASCANWAQRVLKA